MVRDSGVQKGEEVPPRLLVIDDEPSIREILEYEFAAAGWTVFCAADAREGMELGRVRRPDVTVCDLILPDGKGSDVLEALKTADPKMEVIMVTGHASLESAIDCLRRGAYDYVTKPFDLDAVLRAAERALDRRRLARQLVHLKEANRLKTEFLASMSHELRTPLNAVIGYVSLLLDNAYGPLQEKQDQTLRRVDVNARGLLQLINNILDVSKAGAGRMELYIEEFSVEEFLKEVAEGMESIARSKNLSLTWSAPAGLKMKSDRMKLRQVLFNLVGNGLKFTKQGGVDVKVEVLEGGRARITVRDTGMGIAPEDVPVLFQEFKQVNPSAASAGGTGLGLTITRKIATLLGGSVSVESDLGKGSSFIVTVPLEAEPGRPA